MPGTPTISAVKETIKCPLPEISWDGYHVYSVVWTPKAIYWYFDDQVISSYTGEGVAEGSGPMNLLLQLNPEYPEKDENGNTKPGWGGIYDGTGFPYEMKTDWVKAWALA